MASLGKRPRVSFQTEFILPLLRELEKFRGMRFTPEKSTPNIAGKKWPDLTVSEKRAVLDWLVMTCLLYGTQLTTAMKVATEFCKGLEYEAGER